MSDGSKQTIETSGRKAGSAMPWLSLLVAIFVPVSAVLSMVFGKWHTVFLVAAIVLFCNTVVGIAGARKCPARSFSMWAGLIAALASFALACAALLYANLALHWNG
jgi:hypothetical protein